MPTINQELRRLDRRGYFSKRTGPRRGVGIEQHTPPPAPAGWGGTLPEWALFWAHRVLRLQEGSDFFYQYTLLGMPDQPGSFVLTFMELNQGMGINVLEDDSAGLSFHGRSRLTDRAERELATDLGVAVVWIAEDHALSNPVFFLGEALKGRDHSRLSLGVA